MDGILLKLIKILTLFVIAEAIIFIGMMILAMAKGIGLW